MMVLIDVLRVLRLYLLFVKLTRLPFGRVSRWHSNS